MMARGCAFSWFEPDGWISYPTRSSHGGYNVCKDVLALCLSIMVVVHTMMVHNEVDTICCSEHVASDGGTNLP